MSVSPCEVGDCVAISQYHLPPQIKMYTFYERKPNRSILSAESIELDTGRNLSGTNKTITDDVR